MKNIIAILLISSCAAAMTFAQSEPGTVSPVNRAFAFDGVDQYIRLPTMDLPPGGFTLEAWVKLSVLPADLTTDFAGIFDAEEDACVLYLDRKVNELRIKFTTASRAAERPGIRASLLTTNSWFHVAGVYDPADGSATIYFNGIRQDAHRLKEINEPLAPKQTPAIGCNFGPKPGKFFAGCVDELRLWSRARREDELLANMHSPLDVNPPPPNLFAYFRFDELRNGVVPDISGNGWNGRPVGNPVSVDSGVPLLSLPPDYSHPPLAVWNLQPAARSLKTGLMMVLANPTVSDFVVFGHNDLRGIGTNDVPAGIVRARRIWRMAAPSPVTASLTFDRDAVGINELTGNNYVVLAQSQAGAPWSVVATDGVPIGGEIRFQTVSVAEGFYTVAVRNE